MTFSYMTTLPNQKATDYSPGNFSFMADPEMKFALTHAYQVVTDLKVWRFFDDIPENCKLNSFRDHPTFVKIEEALESDKHSGTSLVVTISWLWQIRHKGWNTAVQDNLDKN